jgi:ketosteroid isomerase-like protein
MYRSNATSVPSGGFRDVESIIRGLTQDFCMAFNTGNYDQAATLFAPDGYFMPSEREGIQGSKSVERVLREYGSLGYQDLRLETTRVDFSEDMAIEVGRYAVSIRLENGTTSSERGKFLHGWRRLGAWHMIAACWSSNLPRLNR